jgi:hypothetical protein
MSIKLRAWNQLAEGGEMVTEQKSGWAIRGDDHGPIFLQNDWVLWAGKVIGNIHEPVNPRVGE